MNFIPTAWANQLADDAIERLPRVIARAEAMGDPLGEVPEMKSLLSDLEQERLNLETTDAS